mmetsp:Transcript_34524/g.63210  ORF Transcript_34524/g.63210 Transcript_34524/m.63210 type:complete len:109 (+) Transcript_34524:89-415(+)
MATFALYRCLCPVLSAINPMASRSGYNRDKCTKDNEKSKKNMKSKESKKQRKNKKSEENENDKNDNVWVLRMYERKGTSQWDPVGALRISKSFRLSAVGVLADYKTHG